MTLDCAALANSVHIADGGCSTLLHARGVPTDLPSENANRTHPHLVTALARDFLAAGAEFITTNTFAANRYMLARRGLRDELAEINREGARLAREAVGDSDAAVVGSIGPSGKILAVKEVSEDELTAVYTEQAEALFAGGVDVILLETFSDPAESALAIRAVKDATGLPVIASMSFDSGPQRTRTMMGSQADQCAAALEEAGADIVGCNCGVGIEHVLPIVVALRANTDRPLWVKPNAGMPELEDGRPVYRQTPEEFVAPVKTLIEAGANILGGCCGTGPEHIARLATICRRSASTKN